MTDSERLNIISEDFADLIVSNVNKEEILNTFPSSFASLSFANSSIVHLPIENMDFDSINRFGYNSIPACFGLLTGDDIIHDINLTDLPIPFQITDSYSGKEVLVGFVDTGIDYRNEAFIKNDGTSRIISIWDQTIESANYPEGFYYGTQYLKEQLNEALAAADPLTIVPSTDEIGHGTMLAGIAGGNANASYGFSGVASDISFAVVKLKPAKAYLKEFFLIPPQSICFQENDIISGVTYLNQLANQLKKPLILCFGVGTNLSDHTGSRALSRYLSALGELSGRGVVVSAGNESNRGSHYYGDIKPPNSFEDVVLTVGKDTYGFTLQFWGTSPNLFWINVYSPDGGFISRVPPNTTKSIVYLLGDMTIIIDSQIKDPFTTEQFIIMRFSKPIAGDWHFYVYGLTGDLPMRFHFWLPLHNFLSIGTVFGKPNNYTTIVAPGNNSSLICATAYNPQNATLYFYASKGNTITNFPKPDITAPGVNSVAPYLNNTYVNATGTSISSAYVAGVLALLLEWGVTNGNFPDMNNALLKKIITQSASRRPEGSYPNPDWGYGIIDINKMGSVINSILRVQDI